MTYSAGGRGRGYGEAPITPSNATANTGNGGGGSAGDTQAAANGGSGIVIVRYLSIYKEATGGTITYSGGYTIHTFTASGTFTI